MQDMAKMWKQAKESGMAGGFLWPGGGYMYSTSAGRCRPADASAAGSSAASSLALDLVATEDFYLVYADVPGLSKSDLTIKLSKERVLTVSGERRPPVDEGYQQKERRFGRFERAWTLPEDADSEGISAKVSEGVLTITVPKKQPEPVVDESSEIPIN
jgi:HSP20 family protein